MVVPSTCFGGDKGRLTSEFQANLVYIVSSRTARGVSKQANKKWALKEDRLYTKFVSFPLFNNGTREYWKHEFHFRFN